MSPDLKIAELLCTRLCHDLTGPIGAVNNGAEFLSEEGFGMQNQAVDLIVSSAHEAVARLQFFRMAYGKVNEQGEASLADKKKIVAEYFSASKIALDWPDTHTDAAGVPMNGQMCRLLINLIVIVSSMMVKGGTLSVRLNAREDGNELHLHAQGPMIKWDVDSEMAFNGETPLKNLTPKTIQLYMAHTLAAGQGVRFQYSKSNDAFDLVAKQPAMADA